MLDCVALLLAIGLIDEEGESSKLVRETCPGAELVETIEVECGTEDVLDTVERTVAHRPEVELLSVRRRIRSGDD